MKLFSASAISLSIIQIISTIGAIIGLWVFSFDYLSIIVILVSYYLYSGIGVSMMLHRFYAHKSFEFKYPILKYVFTWFALMSGRGSIIGWVHVHREHHAFSDTEKDPHSPSIKGWRVLFPHLMDYGKKINVRLVRDLLNKKQIYINDYYMLLVLSCVSILIIIDPWIAYFCWFVPVSITHFVLNTFIYFGHNLGYTNHKYKDNSKNLWVYGILLWGEGWHNNHHSNAKNWNMQEKWWELDLIAPLIYLVKK